MSEIYPHIYLGSWEDGNNVSFLVQNKIDIIVNLCGECYTPTFSHIHMVHIPIEIEENIGNQFTRKLEIAADIVELLVKEYYNKNILVHCRAGMERSPLVLALALSHSRGRSFDSIYEYIKMRRPVVLDRRGWLNPS